MSSKRLKWLPSIVAILGLAASAAGLQAQAIPSDDNPLRSLTFASERLATGSKIELVQDVQGILPAKVRDGWTSFVLGAGGEWAGYVDLRSGQIESLVGSGIPWIPGRGNSLSPANIAIHLAGRPAVDVNVLERVTRSFLPRVAPLLGVDSGSLALNRERSGQTAAHLWRISFDVIRGGATVEGARVTFHVNSGNLIDLGVENLPSPGALPPTPKVKREAALKILADHVGGFSSVDTFQDGGSYHVIPVALEDARFAEGFEIGKGRGLTGVWQFTFVREGVNGTWRGRVDAVTGELLDFVDLNHYAYVNGGILWQLNQILRPMPYANTSIPGVTDSAGVYVWPGGVINSTLNSTYVRIADTCGAISQASGAGGNINFGLSPGIDCSTPGTGGAGNTRSSRTQFYHLNRAKEMGRGHFPFNPWLNGQLLANVNILATCNAFWNGVSVNFFRSGGGCNNTGENEGVSLHEYGHGFDSNDGNGFSLDEGTGETYGDFTAALVTHDSCIGRGFFAAGNCGGYGNPCLNCSGIRDIDFAQRAANTPATVANFTQPLCPFGGAYNGPCNLEGHCESYVASEALWDFAERDLPAPGSVGAWHVTDRLWHLSRPTATRAFICNTAPPVWTSNGCGAGTYWREMRAVDDDDGNLANGTPHGGALFAAFNRHLIACTTDPGANVTFAGCAPPAVPTISLTPGFDRMEVAWSSSGAGVVYDVYKNDLGCDAGFAKVAEDIVGTYWQDNQTANGVPYFYYVVAHPPGQEACSSRPSRCLTMTSARLFDVYTKDLPADVGLEPDPALAGQPMWTSPDIWVRNTNTPGPHQNPEFGQVNFVNVNVRNRGVTNATNVPVQVWYANASVGLAWPIDWTLIGTANVAALTPGNTTNITLPWSPPGTGHFCLLSRIVTASDPMTYTETVNVDFNTRHNNNIAWKNVNIVDLMLTPVVEVEFILRNPDVRQRNVRLLFREKQPAGGGFLGRGRIRIDIGEKLAQRLQEQGIEPKGFQQIDDRTFEIADAEAWIDVTLDGREEFGIGTDFEDTRPRPTPTEDEEAEEEEQEEQLPDEETQTGTATAATANYTLEVIQQDTDTGEELGGIAYLITAPQ
ncbi:MAG TPA: hypothetical protein VN493_14585 [Thermoanaerobaculia bacterium]|nr:hypothetical protein [Thermoanaerobaculia bacterium]